MSSKKLQFKQTTESIQKKLFNDLEGMNDISFDTLANNNTYFVDIQLMTPEKSIIQSLKNLLSLPVGGNALFPSRGERISEMLFSPGLFKDDTIQMVKSYLNSNEPRITIHDITSSKKVNDFNEQIITINVSYSFKNNKEIYNAIVDLSQPNSTND